MVDLSTSVKGVSFASCVMNAPGRGAVTYEQLAAIGRSEAGAIVTASMTIDPEAVRPAPSYYNSPLGSVQALGFPNLGYKEYARMIPELRQFGKPVIASISATNLDDFVTIAQRLADAKPDIVQLDISSLVDGRVLGYHWLVMDDILREVRGVVECPLGASLPAFFDPLNVRTISLMLVRNQIDYAILCTPFRIGMMIDAEKEESVVRTDEGGVGLLDGPAIKPVALGDVHLFRAQLHEHVAIWGSAGVASGDDVLEFLLSGANAVQVSDAFLAEGASVFGRLNSELSTLLTRKGYLSAKDAVCKLLGIPVR